MKVCVLVELDAEKNSDCKDDVSEAEIREVARDYVYSALRNFGNSWSDYSGQEQVSVGYKCYEHVSLVEEGLTKNDD